MAVLINSPQAQALSAIADLHESVIGGFWQDLTALAHWDDEDDADRLGMDLYELATQSGLRWPVPVPALEWTHSGRRLTLHCSVDQVRQLLLLYIDVCGGRWSTVATIAQEHTTGALSPTVKRSLATLRRRMQIDPEHQTAAATAQDLLLQLRVMT